MAVAYKLLAQSNPSATTLTDVYTVPGATTTVVSSVTLCNQAGTDTTMRVSIADAGAANTAKQYLYYDLPLLANDTFAFTLGVTLEATDVIRVYAGNANVSVNVFGSENT